MDFVEPYRQPMSSEKKQLEGRLREIAAAARELIAERGFEGLRTRDIAARVGINIATLHYHVPSKEALIAIVAQSIRDDFIAQHQSRPRDGLGPRALLELEFLEFRENLVANPQLIPVLAELTERARRDTNVADAIRPMQSFWHAQIAGILESGRNLGVFRADIDPPVAALMVVGTLIATQRYPDRSLEFFDRVCAELLRALSSNPPRENLQNV